MLSRNKNISPLIGALSGIIPECSIPVISADLYSKNRITIGTVIAVFLACSDEAFTVLIANNMYNYLLYLIIIKISIGFIIGFIIDLIIKEKINYDSIEINQESKIHKHLIHPLIDSIKVLFYALIINTLFGFIVYYVGEENIKLFLESNYYISPILASFVGLIPNCSASILLSTLFVSDNISFGALLSGLLMNAGLGVIYLFKTKENLKKNIFILIVMFITAIIFGYVFMFIK